MVIRKPYAFLIKYFKIIHIVIFITLIFLLFKLRAIYIFFKNYLLNGTYLYVNNMAGKYIGIPLILTIVVLIGIFLLIFLLMKQKKKPIIYYISALVYTSICFIACLFLFSVFSSLEYSSLSNRALALIRDLTMVLYYADFFFLAISFIRGFGFDIKRFNFDKDLEQLDITEKDREEIELESPIDYDKVVNFARRKKRNISYYFKENSYVLIVLLIIISLGLSSYLIIDKLIVNKVYREQQIVTIDKLDFKIIDSYVSNKNINGNVINKNKKFIIIPFEVTNNYDKYVQILTENTRIRINKNYYYPKVNTAFNDLGVVYKSQNIPKGATKKYLFLFEIDNNEKTNTVYLELYAGKKQEDNQIVFTYKTIKLKPTKFKKQDLGKYKINDVVTIDNSYLEKAKLSISKISIVDNETYQYTKCGNDSEGTCLEYNASVVASIGKTLLRIEYSFDNPTDIFAYASLEYQLNNKVFPRDQIQCN